MKRIRLLRARLETSDCTGNLPLNKNLNKKKTIIKHNKSKSGDSQH